MINQDKHPERRTRYFINKGFQLRYMAFMIGAAFLASLVIGGVLFYIIRMNWTVHLGGGLQVFDEIRVLLKYQQTLLIAALAISFIVMSAILSWWSLFLSHRVCGPVFALGRRINQIVVNRDLVTPLFFRKKDTLQEAKDFFNQTLESLRNQIHQEIDCWENILTSLNQSNTYPSLVNDFTSIIQKIEIFKKDKEKWLIKKS